MGKKERDLLSHIVLQVSQTETEGRRNAEMPIRHWARASTQLWTVCDRCWNSRIMECEHTTWQTARRTDHRITQLKYDGSCVAGGSENSLTKWSEESMNVEKDYRLGGRQWRDLKRQLTLKNHFILSALWFFVNHSQNSWHVSFQFFEWHCQVNIVIWYPQTYLSQ
jgi:hypothetical protein